MIEAQKKEYIEREAANREFLHAPMTGDEKILAIRRINSIPAADVAEVRHGYWIKDDETGEPICSVCHSGKPTRAVCSSVVEHTLSNHEIRYCYYCGAKMDGGGE